MSRKKNVPFSPAKVALITVSDTRTLENDKSGQLIIERLEAKGHQLVARRLIKDEEDIIRKEVLDLVNAKSCAFVIVTGGTGIAARDVTPEAIAPIAEKHIPGFGELFRYLSFKEIGTSTIQSRADAWLCGHAVVFALPGSTGACRLAMDDIILPQLDPTHAPCSFRDVIPELENGTHD